jgi:hypothetical protein
LPTVTTHHVRHGDRIKGRYFSADLRFTNTIQAKLLSSDDTERSEARDWVCTQFMQACVTKYGDAWRSVPHNYVVWGQIEVTNI